MSIISVINQSIDSRGITKSELARRTGMRSDLLSRSLKGKRNLKADELVNLCGELDLKIDDFTCNQQKEAS